MGDRPTLAVWKFASCDGCQLSILDCERELISLSEQVEIAHFLEASSAVVAGPYDVSLVEGSITTPGDAERIQRVREMSRTLITIGACATAGGIQALRNYGDTGAWASQVYPSPEYLDVLETSTPIADHVRVDFELRGCPIDKGQLIDVVSSLLAGRRPRTPAWSVCTECKQAGRVCVTVAHGTPCLGPVTHGGCGALCPGYDRGCFGCFGPKERANTTSMSQVLTGVEVGAPERIRLYRTFNAGAPAFADAASAIAHDDREEQ